MKPPTATPSGGDGYIQNGIKLSPQDWASIPGASLNTKYDSSFQNPFDWNTGLTGFDSSPVKLDTVWGETQSAPYTVKRGDDISTIMGTSDPKAIAAFMRLTCPREIGPWRIGLAISVDLTRFLNASGRLGSSLIGIF